MASDNPEWPLKDIIYTGIVGGVMLAALLEWILWLSAFIYCLVQAFRKAEHWSNKVLAAVVGVVFVGLRLLFLPIMVFTLPLPSAVSKYFPKALTSVLQSIAFYAFMVILTAPWVICLWQHLTQRLGRKKRLKQVLNKGTAPKVVVVMPVYNENLEVLITAINSVVDCDYPPDCVHVFLSFDGDAVEGLYRETATRLGIPEWEREKYPQSIDLTYHACQLTLSRFKHGGKRHCQKRTFQLVNKIYADYVLKRDDLFVLFIDSDCILDVVCIQNFMYDMELSPTNKRNMLAMTGIITSTTKRHSLITLLQDIEYVHGQLFERTVESGCGAVTCLPGALTMLRFSAFRKMAKYYFADNLGQAQDLFDYAKCHLGEDRWLTHLFMIGAEKRYQIQMCTTAFCKTEAVQTYKSLVKQRRRWFLGFITNEVCMLTDTRIWRRYPVLACVRFLQNTIRTTALLFFILVIALATTSKRATDLPIQFIGVSLGLNWVMMIYFGLRIKRLKAWLYPLMFILNPFFNWFYMVYGILTAGQRTWGGPRADATKAGAGTTPAQAVERAEEEGDDLNVVPETFIPAGVVRRKSAPLHPPNIRKGTFASPNRLPNGWADLEDSESSMRKPWLRRSGEDLTDSFDDWLSNAISFPRRLDAMEAKEERIGMNRFDIAQRQKARLGKPVFPSPSREVLTKPAIPLRSAKHRARDDLRIGCRESDENSASDVYAPSVQSTPKSNIKGTEVRRKPHAGSDLTAQASIIKPAVSLKMTTSDKTKREDVGSNNTSIKVKNSLGQEGTATKQKEPRAYFSDPEFSDVDLEDPRSERDQPLQSMRPPSKQKRVYQRPPQKG